MQLDYVLTFGRYGSDNYLESSIIHHYGSNVFKSGGLIRKPETYFLSLHEEHFIDNSTIRNKRKIINELNRLTGPTRWKNKFVPYKMDDNMRKLNSYFYFFKDF